MIRAQMGKASGGSSEQDQSASSAVPDPLNPEEHELEEHIK